MASERAVIDALRRPWNISTELIAVLLLGIAIIMTGYAWWFERQHERMLLDEVQRDAELLASAFSYAARAPESAGAPTLTGLISLVESNDRFRVYLYDESGEPWYPPAGQGWATVAEIEEVLTRGSVVSVLRQTTNREAYFVLSPIGGMATGSIGAVELHAPTDAVRATIENLRRRFVIATLLLFVAVVLMLAVTARRVVTKPLRALSEGVRAVSAGSWSYNIPTAGLPREVRSLAQEFNQMAAALRAAQQQLQADAERRIALEREVHRSRQLASVGKLASGLAHQVAAPLNVIAGRTDLVLQRVSNDTDRHDLQIALRQIDRITKTVERLLEVARRPLPNTQSELLSAVVAEAVDFLRPRFRARWIDIQSHIPDAVAVFIDRVQFIDVLEVLMINALQALELVDDTRRVTITASEQGEKVILQIADTGIGISTGDAIRIFDPFYSTKEGGTGLGLMMARYIVEAHGGTILGENRADRRGAVFRITLPTHSEPPLDRSKLEKATALEAKHATPS